MSQYDSKACRSDYVGVVGMPHAVESTTVHPLAAPLSFLVHPSHCPRRPRIDGLFARGPRSFRVAARATACLSCGFLPAVLVGGAPAMRIDHAQQMHATVEVRHGFSEGA